MAPSTKRYLDSSACSLSSAVGGRVPSLGVGGIGGAKFCEIEVCEMFQHFAHFLFSNIIYSISKMGCNVVMRVGLCTDNNDADLCNTWNCNPKSEGKNPKPAVKDIPPN